MQTHAWLGCVAAAALSVGTGCLSPENAERQHLADLSKGIESDRFAVDRATPRVEEHTSPDPDAPAPIPRPAALGNEGSGPEGVPTDDPADTTPRTVIRIWGKSAPSVEVVPAPSSAKDGAARPSPGAPPASGTPPNPAATAQHAYDAAVGLVNAHAYDKAAGALGLFLLEWPSDANASNAMYWQAECYYAMGEYTHAFELFEQAMDRFPKSARVPDCLLKLGLCQGKLGDGAKAKTYFDRLGAEYPRSEAAHRIPTAPP
jgi:tol-pal system protein YbgF